MKTYVLSGPAGCGNVFGFWKTAGLPAGKFAVVEDGELANGGHGPCLYASGHVYDSLRAAQAVADCINAARRAVRIES